MTVNAETFNTSLGNHRDLRERGRADTNDRNLADFGSALIGAAVGVQFVVSTAHGENWCYLYVGSIRDVHPVLHKLFWTV